MVKTNTETAASLKEKLQRKIKQGLKSAAELEHIQRMTTGVPALDAVLGGGLPVGRVIQIWGPESVGKSALCLTFIKTLLDRDPTAEAIYVDCESTVHKGDIEAHGIDEDRLVFFEAFGGEEAIDTALDAIQAGAKIAVIDSVPYLRPVKVLTEIEKDSSYRDVSSIALLMERVQNKIVRTVQHSGAVLIFINQQRPPKGMYEAPSYPGGSALGFMLSCSIHITSASKSKDTPGLITQNVLIRKNKTFTPMLKAEIPMLDRIVQRGQCLLETAVKHGVVLQKGSHYYLDEATAKDLGVETKLGNGAAKAGLLLDSQPALYTALYDKVLDVACRDNLNVVPDQPLDVDY